jgi:hypothetical protein
MNRFEIKGIGIYALEMICIIMFSVMLDIAIYLMLGIAELSELGDSLIFQIGLAVFEAVLGIYCMNQINEDIFDEED